MTEKVEYFRLKFIGHVPANSEDQKYTIPHHLVVFERPPRPSGTPPQEGNPPPTAGGKIPLYGGGTFCAAKWRGGYGQLITSYNITPNWRRCFHRRVQVVRHCTYDTTLFRPDGGVHELRPS